MCSLGLAHAALGEPRHAMNSTSKLWRSTAKLATARGGQCLGEPGNCLLRFAVSPAAPSGSTRERSRFDREISDRRGEGADLGNLGITYAALGESPPRDRLLQTRLAIAREMATAGGEAGSLCQHGLGLSKLADRAQAIANAQAALKIFEEIEDPNADKVRQQLAEWKGESPTA